MDILKIYEICGIFMTAAAALYTLKNSKEANRKRHAAIVSLLGIFLTLLVSIRFFIFPEIHSQFSTAREINNSPFLKSLFTKLANVEPIVDNKSNSLMGFMLKIRIGQLEKELELISMGSFTVDEENMPLFATQLIETAKSTVYATSYVRSEQWWDTIWGRRYEELNYEKVSQGVSINRIFIISGEEELEEIRTHLDRQANNGINVRIARSENLSTNITNDLIVIDGAIAGELRLSPGKGLKDAIFFTKKSDIDEKIRIIRIMENQSVPYKASKKEKWE